MCECGHSKELHDIVSINKKNWDSCCSEQCPCDSFKVVSRAEEVCTVVGSNNIVASSADKPLPQWVKQLLRESSFALPTSENKIFNKGVLALWTRVKDRLVEINNHAEVGRKNRDRTNPTDNNYINGMHSILQKIDETFEVQG